MSSRVTFRSVHLDKNSLVYILAGKKNKQTLLDGESLEVGQLSVSLNLLLLCIFLLTVAVVKGERLMGINSQKGHWTLSSSMIHSGPGN